MSLKTNQGGAVNPLAVVAAVVVLAGAGFGVYTMTKKDKKENSTNTTQRQSDVKLSSTPYQNQEYGFQFTPPEDWTQSQVQGTLVFFSSPQKDNQDGNELAASLNVTTEDTAVSLSEYMTAAKQQLAAALSDYRIVSENNITLADGTKAIALEGTFTQGSYSIHNRQVIVVENGAAFVLTASALANSWDKYKATFEASQNTFRSL